MDVQLYVPAAPRPVKAPPQSSQGLTVTEVTPPRAMHQSEDLGAERSGNEVASQPGRLPSPIRQPIPQLKTPPLPIVGLELGPLS
ncbi:hypothetical protein AAFF_G00127070 [Aldrovandia affinis]|uniref:Uncharacterized protein n=1 Tax=Aldrovandia affinis TaxID=143900 RepID=A0AAD7T2S8_9TELE|nr:hypothetical protein AAFF_G00127070 [Aldrovandia affinis]